jgi:hypothetical protein
MLARSASFLGTEHEVTTHPSSWPDCTHSAASCQGAREKEGGLHAGSAKEVVPGTLTATHVSVEGLRPRAPSQHLRVHG